MTLQLSNCKHENEITLSLHHRIIERDSLSSDTSLLPHHKNCLWKIPFEKISLIASFITLHTHTQHTSWKLTNNSDDDIIIEIEMTWQPAMCEPFSGLNKASTQHNRRPSSMIKLFVQKIYTTAQSTRLGFFFYSKNKLEGRRRQRATSRMWFVVCP